MNWKRGFSSKNRERAKNTEDGFMRIKKRELIISYGEPSFGLDILEKKPVFSNINIIIFVNFLTLQR